MSKLIIVVFSLLGLISACVGETAVIQDGLCDDNVPVKTDFDGTRFLGVWYDIESLPSTFQTGTCNTATYSLNTNGSLNVLNTQVVSGVLKYVIGTAESAGTAKFYVSISGAPPVPYWVLATDYTTYALMYSCRNIYPNRRQVNSWKLGRNKGALPSDAANTINNIIANVQALSAVSDKYIRRIHTTEACSYFVDSDGPCPVVTGVTNFDIPRYLGTWYEVARYPQTTQTGQCSRAQYTLGADGSVTVMNSEVIDEALSTISGTATAVLGQSGVLSVTFSVGPAVVSQNLYVLATDYDTYALVYSCAALEGNKHRISSWKLSKNKNELDQIAIDAINDAINNRPELDEVFYQETSQTDAACLYYPEFDSPQPIIELPGPCNTSITGVPNFDVARYLGTWYEVARYPQPTQAGQCSRAQYTLGTTGSVTVMNSEVIDEALRTMSGTATAVPGQSGVLEVTFTIAGVPRKQNLYVLATDYDNYALVYSCTNIEGNRRQVGSWKLSKSNNPLTAEANNAINNVIATTQGLNPTYYQETSQTDAACFYYPEFDSPQPIIELPGPCNTSITGVPNFDVARYLGTWYEVARYPQPTQAGQCSRAQYTLGTTGSVTVMNSEVIDEALRTMSGTATAVPGQSGVLEVTFTIAGVPRKQNLYVLATDYDNYALVYSCTNIEGNRRQVGSWKLSKSNNPLTAEANNAINNVIATTQGLNPTYYQETSQTDAACFYYPEFDSPQAIIELPGPCNTSITGVPNFDVARYLGTWYEVAKYPQPTQTGQCSRAQYTLGADGSVTVNNSEVIDEALSTMLGTATAVPGQSGVLEVTFTIAGVPRKQNLYVLATDYDNYALVYSCTNIEGNRRQVGSWKLSKSNNPLTAEANNAINNVIATTQGLNPTYYQETSQTDAACFYYPEFDSPQAIIELPGPCNTSITGVPNFDVARYLGTWYEVAKYPQPTQTGQCSRAQYTLGADGSVTVNNSEVIDEALSTMLGTATAVPGQSGVLEVTFTIAGVPRKQNLYVLATDYDNYALVYSCTNIEGNRRQVGSWKLSKSNNPLTAEANNAINNVIATTQGLNQTYYQETSQTDAACFYYPEFDSPQPIIELPGPCNTSITGVPNFDVARYLGTWYEVARYPQPTQAGQCSRAQYTLGTTGSVTVMNSEVIDEALRTMSGTATAVPGQSGVLEVTFTIAGVPRKQNLYVLATDYDNYALVYSCTNIEGNRRQVGSWKLSKSNNPLTAEANNAINNVIATTQGLNQTYYQETSQTDAACFYYPEFDSPQPIIELPGPCNTSITGVPNFDVARYLGTWYEVAKYPQPTQTGQCSRAQYTLGADGSVTVNNSEVIDEALSTMLGTATAVPGQSGVLEVTFTIAGVPRKQNLYVLATDYDNYALAYSCTNIEGNRRQVGSWKLSKSNSPLTAEANNAINNVIATTQGLNQTYYQETSQTDAACFYYPEFDSPQPIIELPGPCNTSITGVPNFDVARYLGTWYEVARYPQPTQTGQCSRAQYTLGADGSVTVNNSEVIDEALSTMLGTATAVPGQSGVLEVTFTIAGVPRKQNLYVLATDYDNYALVYSCTNIEGNRRQVGSWKLSKSNNQLTAEANNAINNVIATTQGLNQTYYQETSQTDAACFYYPEFDSPQPIIELPGPCNTSITGVPNFDVARYLGTWYEVAKYPQPTQTGQCSRAQYTLGADGSVTVNNSEVIDEALSTMLGTATAVPGQSGVLEVTFTIAGVPRKQNLYVLATDYDNYALVYSCTNIEGNRRQVGSWKLSKSNNPLTAEANNAINNVIATTQGLNQTYYQETSQTDAACFYYPEFDSPQPIIELPGPCNTSITGVPNFDVARYLGTWYEVARYPQPTQAGQCSRAQYTLGTTGSVTVMNSEVIDEALRTMSGTATAVPGQSGVLEVTFTIAGVPRKQNLYVLATDYDNYALVYSCTNIEGNRRQVGSWKLSKSNNPLTAEANNAINNVIATTQGLNQTYYQETSQTDAACFYYPEFDSPQPIIELPGPCNTSITGVPNFDVARYLGTWYEVAKYPQPTQTGQCSRAQYTLGADGSVIVNNSEVIDEALSTMLGTATAVPGQSGVLEVTFTIAGVPRKQNLYVLATDYDNYALVYSCTNIEGNRRQVGSWKLSKSNNPLTAEANNAINNVIATTQGLNQTYYQETSQTDAACFYYPEFDSPQPIIELPGPCNTSITGVPNFDVARYLGTWYEVAKYPQPTQTGQCSRAQYTLGADGSVTVNNSEVIDEALSTMLGTATAVPGQSGVLEVTFTIAGVPRKQNLYVLATDYDNYALVYSCTNIEGNRRQVGSWKLSKSNNQLTAEANNAINNVIATTQGLNQTYYQETSQTDAACFYYPEFDSPQPIIELPGPCNTSITGVPDFDVARYLGTWYEVARYPQPTQTGQCNRAQYTLGADGSVTVNNSEVTDETLRTMLGTATAVPGQSGVLEVTFTVAGVPRKQNLYVLATDYDNYALVYSCTNIEGNRRQVGSWKLSKSNNPLSVAANNVLDNVVTATQGLRENYYQETSQTDAACWHYLPQNGPKVIIPGQCDTSISGQANINLTVFANSTWYHIQRYDAVEGSSCIGSKLVYDGGNIKVNFIEVIGEDAKKTEGVARLTTAESGKFTLEMADSEEKEEIYILATDYNGYAVAYSCKNNGTENRQIGAWQLSRGRTMPAAGIAAVDRLVAERREFTRTETYFKPITQREDCPEPSSAFLFKSSIIVIFVCTILQLV